ncbi:hypothetical protein [Salininema proteolyticum]|uniref:Uncharacterized protein n=1 Tax=Salininema proteolyticum TaxID=1607685 RepID=A0ABV8U4D0_9ACTN
MNTRPLRIRLGALAMAVAGVLFLVYEILPPRLDQETLAGAESWAEPGWVAGHVAAMFGLILFPVAWAALRTSQVDTRAGRPAFLATVTGYFGVAMTLPFYGGETYGLRAIGRHAEETGDPAMADVGNSFREDLVAMPIGLVGMILLITASILAAVSIWRSGELNRWSGVPFAVLIALYYPHFLVSHSLRIVWGALVLLSAFWVARELWRAAALKGERSGGRSPE